MFQDAKYALNGIVDWLEERPEGWGYASLFAVSLFTMFFVSILSNVLLNMFSAPMVSYTWITAEPAGEIGVNCLKIMTRQFWEILVLAAMLEELLFRLLPLVATALVTALVVCLVNERAGKNIDIGKAVIVMSLLVAVPVSLYFGYGHGNIFNLFIQGFTGFILSMVYIKCGGVSLGFLKGFAFSSVLHFTFNAIIFLNAVSSGMVYFSF